MKFSAYFLLSLIFYSVMFCESTSSRDIVLKNLSIGRKDKAFRIPEFLMLPALIVLPVLNHKQNEDSYKTINKSIQDMFSVNLTELRLNNNIQEDSSGNEMGFRQALDKGNSFKNDLRQIQVNETHDDTGDLNSNGINTEKEVEVSTQEATTLDINIALNTTTEFYINTEIQGPYSNSRYNNTDINSLAITIQNPDYVLYPPLKDEQWKNFTMNTNVNISKENITESELLNSLNITDYPSVSEPNSPIKGVYKDPLYNNAEIDQLSITTNSYTNELPLPPPQDDRWSNFSSLKKMLPPSNEFRPLAGLYYDGFLHRSVTKSPGFVPYNHYYFY